MHCAARYLSLMAALKKPQWVRGVVMLDSPVVAGWRSSILRVSQFTGLDERLSPACRDPHAPERTGRAATRRGGIFHSKPAFARWDERMLSDYIEFGIPQVSRTTARAVRVLDRRIEYRDLPDLAAHARCAARAQAPGAGGFHRRHALEGSPPGQLERDERRATGEAYRMDRGRPSVSDGKADRNRARAAADVARTERARLGAARVDCRGSRGASAAAGARIFCWGLRPRFTV